jgi:hypothetical protein
VPVKAVIDYLSARSDVDSARIAVYGGGEPGGYLMTRAATHEKRIAACIVDPLVSDMEPIAPLFTRHVLHVSEEKETLGSIYAEVFPLMWGIANPSQAPEVFRKMKADPRFITCPTLCLNDAHDYPELLEQARSAVTTIANKRTVQRIFIPEDGTSYRQLDNFGLKHRVMFDWLDEIFDSQGK